MANSRLGDLTQPQVHEKLWDLAPALSRDPEAALTAEFTAKRNRHSLNYGSTNRLRV
jgi:hypothetical protein